MNARLPEIETPAVAHLPMPARIVDVRQENYRTRTLVLDCALDAYPGQFVMLWMPRFDEKPYSLVSANPVSVMVTRVGPFSDMVANSRPGDRIWLRGPFGNGFHPYPEQRRIALVGGGYGVAPLSWLAEAQAGISAEITAILGARTAADLLFAGRFQRIDVKGSFLRTFLTTEDGTSPTETPARKGRVTDALAPMLEAGALDAIFACGPHGMLAAIESLARRYRVPAQLSWEAYMRCAIGICGACEHNGKLLCLDGPVLETQEQL